MPGSIQVSVLNFNGSQSSSPSTQMSLKVAMGKREYQTWDKGDFSFPVTTLRDNLIVTLLDAEGNVELSRTVLETRWVIEKGTLEDTFLLEGGGQVHMKLQFVLNDEDRQRIRTMRESALRKKHEELNFEARSPEHTTKTSSHHHNHEVSDPEKSSLPGILDQGGLTSPEGKSGANDGERTHSVEREIKPVKNDTDRYERISSTSSATERFDVQLKKEKSGNLNEKGAVGAFQKDSPIRKVFPKESEGISGSTVSVKCNVSFDKEDGASAPGNQRSEQKPPSKVRNMISAFECSHNEDMRSKTEPLPIKSQSSKIGVNFPHESSYSDRLEATKVKSGDSSPWTVKDTPNAGNVKPTPTPVRNEEEPLDLGAPQFQTIGKNVDLKNRVKVMQKEPDQSNEKMSFEHSTRSSAGNRASVSRRVHYDQRYSDSHLVGKISNNGAHKKGSQNLDIQVSFRSGMFSAEHSVAWIFPCEQKHFCITGGKKLMNFTETCQVGAKSLPGMMSSSVGGSLTESVEHVANEFESSKGDTSLRRRKNPEKDGSPDGENPRGLLAQVVRVAIIVGFATLVFFTRQRSPDPKKAKGAKSSE